MKKTAKPPRKAATKNAAETTKKYAIRTRLIHGKSKTPKWDYSHHVIPPITSTLPTSTGVGLARMTGFVGSVTPAQVKAIRDKVKGQPASFSPDELLKVSPAE